MESIPNYWNGAWHSPLSGEYLPNINPATGQIYSYVPQSSSADLEAAVVAGQEAFPSWSALPVEERAAILAKIAQGISENTQALAKAESIDSGKLLSMALRMDIPRAAQNFLFYSQAITQFASEAHDMGALGINYTLHEPLGLVACISPWNLPLYLLTWKIAPALAAGNCVIAKPSEVTPMTAYLLTKICEKAGLPPGVLAILHGEGGHIGAQLSKHPSIKALSFTGGTATGRQIASAAAPSFKKVALEMGGKNAALVFADCKLEETVASLIRASFSNQGQICLCSSRILVEEKIFPAFKEAFVTAASALVVGDPLEATSHLGALVSAEQQAKVLSYIDLAKEEGGQILCGGGAVRVEGRCSQGYFMQPTVITGLNHESRCNQEEVFGPFVTLQAFRDEEEGLFLANQSEYGLSATIWSQDISRCHRLSRALQAGIIWVNSWLLRDLRTPFGGYKQSGVGREGGLEALHFYTQAKNICISYVSG